MLQHTKKYGVYHWDTFDNETLLLFESDSMDEIDTYVESHYKGRFAAYGADYVEVVDRSGTIVKRRSVC